MLHLVLRCVLAAVLVAAAIAKLRRPAESGEALRGLAGFALPAAAVAAVELALAAGVVAGLDAAAIAAAAFLAVSAALLARALARGRAGAPCGCFGARSRITRLALARAAALAGAFAALPFVPRTDPAAEAWLAAGLVVALAGVAALGVAVMALAREVGMLRLAVGPQAALEIPDEGPPLGADSGLGAALDPRPGADLALAIFTSQGCRLCQALAPGIASLSRHPKLSVVELDEVSEAHHWERLGIPGSPFAVALDREGVVLAKGTFNSLGQLESVLATAERRLASSGEPVHA